MMPPGHLVPPMRLAPPWHVVMPSARLVLPLHLTPSWHVMMPSEHLLSAAVGALDTVLCAGTAGDPPQRSALSLCWMEDNFWDRVL